jgi:hypothetical protein
VNRGLGRVDIHAHKVNKANNLRLEGGCRSCGRKSLPAMPLGVECPHDLGAVVSVSCQVMSADVARVQPVTRGDLPSVLLRRERHHEPLPREFLTVDHEDEVVGTRREEHRQQVQRKATDL